MHKQIHDQFSQHEQREFIMQAIKITKLNKKS